jgi:streptomycin 6-kinase
VWWLIIASQEAGTVTVVPEFLIVIPERFAAHTLEVYGEDGRNWLARLPTLVGELAEQWQLDDVGEPFALSYNYVLPARRRDGGEVVVKIAADDEAIGGEVAALRHYAGRGACRLLAHDGSRLALLLERLRPGEMLSRLAPGDDEAATRIGAAVMRELWHPVPAGATFQPIEEWFTRAFRRHQEEYGGSGPLPADLYARGEALAGELLASAPIEVVLHGDFHHYNVLSADRAPWLAIDPKGMRGDPGYEAGPFLHNPNDGQMALTAAVLRRRLDVLAGELGYDRARLRDWGIAHAVLSAVWSAEDEGHGWEGAVAVGQRLIGL